MKKSIFFVCFLAGLFFSCNESERKETVTVSGPEWKEDVIDRRVDVITYKGYKGSGTEIFFKLKGKPDQLRVDLHAMDDDVELIVCAQPEDTLIYAEKTPGEYVFGGYKPAK